MGSVCKTFPDLGDVHVMLDAGLLSMLHWKTAHSDSLTVLLLCISNLSSEGLSNKRKDIF